MLRLLMLVLGKIIVKENQDDTPKLISTPPPPIPAMKHWNPHDSSSATTLSTTVPDSTD